jgi:hypothetical protein
MHRKKLAPALFLILLCITAAPVFGDPGDSIEEIAGKGLVIRSVPARARVFIDGIERGLTPMTFETLPRGEHRIRLEKEGFVERRIWVTLRENSRLEVSITLEELLGTVILDITRKAGSPSPDVLALDPEISAEGKTQTDPVISLPVGYRIIRVRAFGWEESVNSVYVTDEFIQRMAIELRPAPFRMTDAETRRSRFNPANPGSLGNTEFTFNVSAPGQGQLTIEDAQGEPVFTKDLNGFTGWSQAVAWNGRDAAGSPLPDGVYRAVIRINSIPWNSTEPVEQRVEIPVRIDGSLDIHPVSLSAGPSGLFFSPLPEILPQGSFQIDGSLLFGKPPGTDAWSALPFSVALRVSPLKSMELGAALNVTAAFYDQTISAIGGSIKWTLKKSRPGSPLGMAAGLSYAWAEAGTRTPFGMGIGAAISLPLAWRLGEILSLALSPGMLWTGDEGYPTETIPRAVLAGGVLARQSFFTAGISLRSEYHFTGGGIEPGPLMAGAEIKLFPPPSNFVFSFLGGGWFEGGNRGLYGGVGIGLIY